MGNPRAPKWNEDEWCTVVGTAAHSMDRVLMSATHAMTRDEILEEALRRGYSPVYENTKSADNHLKRLAGLRPEHRGVFIKRIDGKPQKWIRVIALDPAQFVPTPLPDDSAIDRMEEPDSFLLSEENARELVMRQIRERRGRESFRRMLCDRFQNRCVVTGCSALAVLEAAHIMPYRCVGDNDCQNGLLLRADIHTLFDLDLLSIEPRSWIVRIHPRIEDQYGEYAGKRLIMPIGIAPSIKAIEHRYNQFQKCMISH